MSAVWEWVRNITLVVILFSFVEILLPGGTVRGYLKFVFSLVVLAMILSPVSAAINANDNLAVAGTAYVSEVLRQQQVQGGEDDALQRVQTKQIQTVYQEKLTEKLTETLKEKFSGISVASVEIYINNEVRSSEFGAPSGASITIDNPDYEKAVRDFVSEQLQVEKRSVTIALAEE